MGKCFICLSDATDELIPNEPRGRKSWFRVDCTQCGVFLITEPAKENIKNHPQEMESYREKIVKYIKNHTSPKNPLQLDLDLLKKIINGEEQ